MGRNYYRDSFRQDLDQTVRRDLFTNARIIDSPMLLRSVDQEAVNKARMGRMFKESGQIRRMDKNDVEEEWREKQRARRDVDQHAFEFSLAEMNSLPILYYNTYGKGHNGSPCVDEDGLGWDCPHCRVHFQTTLASMPMYCPRCGETTPMGQMIEDGVLRR
jgi:hypothetical protein